MTNNENELLDVYGEDGMETGEVLPKSEIHKNGILHKSVQIWLLNDAGQLLMQQRGLSKKLDPGRWTVTGGHVGSEEESKLAAVRELYEEMGIEKDPEELLYLGSVRNTAYVSDDFTENEILDVYITATFITPEEIPENGEVMATKYFSVVELENQYASLNPDFVVRAEAFSLVKEYIYGPGQN